MPHVIYLFDYFPDITVYCNNESTWITFLRILICFASSHFFVFFIK